MSTARCRPEAMSSPKRRKLRGNQRDNRSTDQIGVSKRRPLLRVEAHRSAMRVRSVDDQHVFIGCPRRGRSPAMSRPATRLCAGLSSNRATTGPGARPILHLLFEGMLHVPKGSRVNYFRMLRQHPANRSTGPGTVGEGAHGRHALLVKARRVFGYLPSAPRMQGLNNPFGAGRNASRCGRVHPVA